MEEKRFSKKKIKESGKVYTPSFIVKNILDLSGYVNDNIVEKHVIDNSCGDGSFLVEVVRRYCLEARRKNIEKNTLKTQLETYIHGIEIEYSEYLRCIANSNEEIKHFGLDTNINWDIVCGNALEIDRFNGKMDFVLGNPPYVRIHNLKDTYKTVKDFSFASSGMTDLYIVFYEIGLKMLNENGILGYISPSSFFNSLAGKTMRETLIKENLIDKIVDLKHKQVFDAITYTSIVILNKKKKDAVSYYEFDESRKEATFVEDLETFDFYIDGSFYFSKKEDLNLLKEIITGKKESSIKVKNGFATLADNIFIGNFDFGSEHFIPIIKASRQKETFAIYPYDENGQIIDEEELKKDKALYRYLSKYKKELSSRSLEKGAAWYSYGRSQAINDVYKNKVAINTIIKSLSDLKVIDVSSGTGIYAGLYLVGTENDLKTAKNALKSHEFIKYVKLLGKYKNGGYYAFSSKDVKTFLDYKIGV